MADLPSSGAGENESAAVEGEAGHVVVQIDDKPDEVEQVEDAIQVDKEVKEEEKEEAKEEVVEEVKEEVTKEEAAAVTEGESERAEGEGVMGEEGDRDSLVPGTGSINGDLDAEEEEDSDEDGDEENMGNVVQGTTETILNKLEENLSQAPPVAEGDLLQVFFFYLFLMYPF